jgi:glycosyltransferase involved in cell wall biosynthesis
MASGRPVIAYGRGGALETVKDGHTGLLFKDQSVAGLIEAVKKFEDEKLEDLDPAALVRHAARFNEAAFTNGITQQLAKYGLPLGHTN